MQKFVLANFILAGITILSSTAIADSLIGPHHFERFTAIHLSSLNCQTPDDWGVETTDHYRNWSQLFAKSNLNSREDKIMQSWLTVFFLLGKSWVPGDQFDGWASRPYVDDQACSDRRDFAENYTKRYPFNVDSRWICNVGGPATKAPAFVLDAPLTPQVSDW